MNDPLPPVIAEQAMRSQNLGPPRSRKRPYDNRPRSGPGRAARQASTGTNAVRVVLPDEPPTLTPGAARALLRVLLKAHAQLTGNTQGAAE